MTATQPQSRGQLTISTLRLRLRSYAPQHWLAMIEGSEQFERSFGVRAAEGLRNFLVEVSPRFLAQLREANGADPWRFGFAVIHREHNLVIGGAGFKGPPDDEGMVEIGYGIVSAFEGRGYATEAAQALINFAVSDPRVRALRAHTLPTANASTRVLTKNGFARVGEVVDPEDGRVWRWERTTNKLGDQIS
ncbi:MAG: GNAT family N-acetyltransferase [Verrucomicrobia bacterium]|nr:GNAT family N-acetyltransferase [Verrucomicrobiota bacterium]